MDRNQEPDVTAGSQAAAKVSRRKRPLNVTVLIVGVLLFTALNSIRFILSISYFGFLSSRLAISPIYLVITGFIWGLAGLILVWGLWKVKFWAPRLMLTIALTYALYFWLDQIFLSEHMVSGSPSAISVLLPVNWMFSAGVTVISLGYIAWVMNRSKVKVYFSISDLPGSSPWGENIDEGDADTRGK
jgi:hypothetical protein